jgi:hypothetical protein
MTAIGSPNPVAALIVLCALSALQASNAGGQVRPSASPATIVHDGPVCETCTIVLGSPRSVLGTTQDSSLWFARIVDAELDHRGRLYVADVGRHDVVRVDLGTGTVKVIGREGAGPGEFRAPLLMEVLEDDRLAVYDIQLNRISLFDTAGRFVSSVLVPDAVGRLESMAADNRGNLYVTARRRLRDTATLFHKLSLQGELLASIPDNRQAPSAKPVDPMSGTQAGVLWWDEASQTLWLSRRGPSFELLQLDPAGRILQQIKLRDGDIETENQAYRQSTLPDGRVAVRPSQLRGTVLLLPLPGGYLANASVLPDGQVRFDVFRTADSAFYARWVEPDTDQAIAFSDGRSVVLRISEDPPDLIAYRARLGKPR